jgi:pilus assembly protein CpaB
MNRSTLIIVACGLVFALLAALTVQMLSGTKRTTTADAPKTIEVLIAAKDLKTGDTISAGSLQWSTWPETSNFAGAIIRAGTQKPEEALKGRVKRAVAKGEPVLTSLVIEDSKTSFIAGTIGAGKRAITINVNAQSGLAGFLNPGDAVDVILTYDVKIPNDDKIRESAALVVNKYASETILENLRVLAVDQDTKKTEPKTGKTVTLEATPAQAESLTLATKMGGLSLALRPVGDASSQDPAKKSVTDLRLSGVMKELLTGENNASPTTQVVRVYTGTRIDNIEVRLSQ